MSLLEKYNEVFINNLNVTETELAALTYQSVPPGIL
jgi:hypothetical protein